MRASELMTKPAATVRPDQHLDRAAQLMRDVECGCTPVVDGEERILGILTDRDICMAALREDRPLSQIPIEAAMRRNVHCCVPEATIAEVEHRMARHQIRRLPVVDEGRRVIGLVSLDDLALEARREKDLIRPIVSEKGVGKTLGQIDRPHLDTTAGA